MLFIRKILNAEEWGIFVDYIENIPTEDLTKTSDILTFFLEQLQNEFVTLSRDSEYYQDQIEHFRSCLDIAIKLEHELKKEE